MDASGTSPDTPGRRLDSPPTRLLLARVSGRDRPGITAALLEVIARAGLPVHDLEQVTTRQRLSLDLLIEVPGGDDAAEHSPAADTTGTAAADAVLKELLFAAWELGLHVDVEAVDPVEPPRPADRYAVTVMGSPPSAAALAAVAKAVSAADANIDRITRLSRYPVVSFELVVSAGDEQQLRAGLVAAAHEHAIDVALQREGLERRAKRLVVMDVDSTLIQDEVIELLAEEAGRVDEVRALTERAMAGELDFESALRQRVALLAGLPEAALDRVRQRVRLTPGARTFVRTLRRLGFRLAIVSGGFTLFTDHLRDELGLDHAYANVLEVVDGRVTGQLVGPIVDRARKARILEEVAAAEGVPVEQTVAIGDGANDLDLLARAGLGIAFNAKPAVRDAADTAVSVPYLDAVLFVLGIRHEDVEIDRDLVPVPGTPPL